MSSFASNRKTLFVRLFLLAVLAAPTHLAQAQSATSADFVAPKVFQAAGPNIESIQATVQKFRDALGGQSNGNNIGTPPFTSGRREINWDGVGSPTTTTPPVTPLNTFLNSRGAQFTTPGTGLSQATPAGLATLFTNPSYNTAFSAFSLFRLFTPVGSNVTDTFFFVPGSGGTAMATVKGFGAVFTDVDQPNGSGPGEKQGNRKASTLILFFGAHGQLLYSSLVPASPGNGSFSFLGIVFEDARIASVRIIAGDVAPGPNDTPATDIVMMDDFIYGEPQLLVP